MSVQEKLSFLDLPALNSSPAGVRDKFKQIYGVNPDGIAVNSETYFDAVEPAITERYGHPCYKTLGDFTYKPVAPGPPSSIVIGSNYAANYGDQEAEISLTVAGSWSSELSWSSSSTTGLSFSTGFSIGGAFESGLEFSVSTTVGQSESKSQTQSSSATVTVKVPPKSKKKVTMIGKTMQELVDFEAPIWVAGIFGANFPKKVQQHYFLFESASTVLNSTSGRIEGRVKNSTVFDVDTEIGDAVPLTLRELETRSLSE